jgi:GGDEF domain-containing protein
MQRRFYQRSKSVKNCYRQDTSFGVASYPESAKSKDDLIRLADEAMYKVKYQTRNAVYAIV